MPFDWYLNLLWTDDDNDPVEEPNVFNGQDVIFDLDVAATNH